MTVRTKVILLAEDDPVDRELIAQAIAQGLPEVRLDMVRDGEELLAYLRQRVNHPEEDYTGASRPPMPSLVLIDLSMPRKSGLEALREIKEDPDLRRIPVVVLTGSGREEDVWQSYDLGVNAFITKPTSREGLARVIRTLGSFMIDTARAPGDRSRP